MKPNTRRDVRGFASMGPRPFGRGGRPNVDPGKLHGASFNGATAFRPWRTRPSAPPACLLPVCCGIRASMGPQPFGCGRHIRSDMNAAGRPECRFNGATAFRPWRTRQAYRWPAARGCRLQWGHGLSAVEDPGPPRRAIGAAARFNGATAFRPWRTTACRAGNPRSWPLQWGHGLSAVDDRTLTQRRWCLAPEIGSSLLQWGHGVWAVEDVVLYSGRPALGETPELRMRATAIRPWKTTDAKQPPRWTGRLQWGHGHSTV